MKRHWLVRALCLALCACLCALPALGEEEEQAISKTRFTLSAELDASAFPEGASPRLKDWQSFLSKLSFSGTVCAQDFWGDDECRRYDAALLVDGKERVPFLLTLYDHHYWVESPAFGGERMFFNMMNFYEFMLKPYYFMGLPTNRLAFLLWPYGNYRMANMYAQPVSEALAGEGTRTVDYDTLYELACSLDDMYYDDWANFPAHYVLALLVDLGVDDWYMDIMTDEGLTDMESWLDYLDPDQQGMTITQTGSAAAMCTEYAIGGQTLLTTRRAGDAESFCLRLQNEIGFALQVDYDYAPAADGARLSATLAALRPDGSTGFSVSAQGEGLPMAGMTQGEGKLHVAAGGLRLGLEEGESLPFDFGFGWQNSTPEEEAPHTDLWLSYLHPQTGKAALTLRAGLDDLGEGTLPICVIADYTYDNDVFGVNSGSLDELKKKVKLPLALAMVPVLMEAPAGVINDVVELLSQTGVLAVLGIE